MERKGPDAPKHLVVFITSDEDFSEKITELRSRNFTVEVIYHNPSASKRPVSIVNAANRSYDWLTFLHLHLKQFPNLTLRYDPALYHPVTRFNRSRAAVLPICRPPGNAPPQRHAYGAAQQPAANAATWRQTQADAASGQSRASNVQPQAPSRQPVAVPQSNMYKHATLPDAPTSGKPGAALVAIYGLEEGKLSVSTKCSFLLARVLGQQVTKCITVTVVSGIEGPVAMLDFAAVPDPVGQAEAAVRSLDGQFFDDEAIRAEFVGHAYTAPSKASRPATSQTSSQANSASAGSSRAAAWAKPLQSEAGSMSKATASPVKILDTVGSGVPARGSQPVQGTFNSSPAQNNVKEQGQCSNAFVSEAQTSPSANSNGIERGAGSGKPCITGAAVSPCVVSSNDVEVCWGSENPLDGGTELFHDDMVNLELQYQRLHQLDSADRPASEHRYDTAPIPSKHVVIAKLNSWV